MTTTNKNLKTFLSNFGKSYQMEIIGRYDIQAIIDSINMNDIINQVYNELPDLQGCSNTCYLNVATGDTFTHIQVGNGGIVEDGHLVQLYSLTRGESTDFSIEDIAGDDDLPESGSVKDFEDYEERVLNCLEYNFENQDDFLDKITEQLDSIYIENN